MLWLTSLFFLTNAARSAARGYYGYAIAFVTLATTSYIIHSLPPEHEQRQLISLLDQMALWCVILIGAFYWQQLPSEQKWTPLALVLAVGVIWYGGRLTDSFTFSPNEYQRKPAHGIFHLFSSIGHHAILATL